jgi:hypothetical protein
VRCKGTKAQEAHLGSARRIGVLIFHAHCVGASSSMFEFNIRLQIFYSSPGKVLLLRSCELWHLDGMRS